MSMCDCYARVIFHIITYALTLLAVAFLHIVTGLNQVRLEYANELNLLK